MPSNNRTIPTANRSRFHPAVLIFFNSRRQSVRKALTMNLSFEAQRRALHGLEDVHVERHRVGAGQDPGQLCYIAAMIITTHLQFVKRTLAAVALLMAAAAPATPQAGDLRGNYNSKSGLITISIDSGIDIKVVTTDAVPGKKCEALETQFPVMVLPTSGALGGRTLADGAIRGMKSLRQAAVEAGANSVVGLRTAPYITRTGNPRIFVYGTLANCE